MPRPCRRAAAGCRSSGLRRKQRWRHRWVRFLLEQQDLGGKVILTGPTSLYDAGVPKAIGPYWNKGGRVFIQLELEPLENAVGKTEDRTFGMVRTEIHCRRCGGHLGHVFDDGPKPTGLRYCMDGFALVFHPAAPSAT